MSLVRASRSKDAMPISLTPPPNPPTASLMSASPSSTKLAVSRTRRSKSRSRQKSTTTSTRNSSSSIHIRQSSPSTPESGSETDFVGLLDPPIKSRFTPASFIKASAIIRSIKNPRPKENRPTFSSDEERILTYELTVAILKYSSFLNEALEKSQFFIRNPQLQNVGQEELLVMLYDLIERDFRISIEEPVMPDSLILLQKAILESKTKLMAHIAKLRIKHEASTLENLLPTNLSHQHSIDKNPLYFWVNLKKAEMAKIIVALKAQGLQETRYEDDTLIQENLFSVSRLHPDLIRMNSSRVNTITSIPLYRDGYIVTQDKSACLPVYVLAKALYFKEAIYHRGAGMENLNPFPNGFLPPPSEPTTPGRPDPNNNEVTSTEDDWYHGILEGPGKNFVKPDCIVVTHCGPGRSAAHLAILLAEAVPPYLSRSVNMTTAGTDLVKAIKSKFVYRPPLNVVVFGAPGNKHDEISRYIKKTLGITNIRLYSDDFISVHPKDPRIKKCGAILVNPPSSGSALKDPVSYICSEGGDEQILTQFSQFVSSATTPDDNNGNHVAYSPNQAKYLNHALSIPNVKLVLYTTCSNLACENAEVVRVCLAEARRREEARKCQVYASIVMQSQSKLYRDVSYEVVNLSPLMEGYGDTVINGDYVDMHPSSACSGVFMSLIRRRDKQINIARNPVKQFVASQIKFSRSSRSSGGFSDDGGGSGETTGPPSLTNFSNGISSFTEEELAKYLMHKLNLVGNTIDTELLSTNATPSTIPVFQANMKKRSSKKAIVKRVSTPTHSSMQRQSEKFYGGSTNSGCNSGAQTPRSGMRTPVKMGETSANSSRSTTGHNSTCGACPHHGHHVCVCARHAKKFPDLVKNI